MLCAFTIAAGFTVSRLLPGRLALWQLPRVSAGRRPGRTRFSGPRPARPASAPQRHRLAWPARSARCSARRRSARSSACWSLTSRPGECCTPATRQRASPRHRPTSWRQRSPRCRCSVLRRGSARRWWRAPVRRRSCWSAAVTRHWRPARHLRRTIRSRPPSPSSPGRRRRRCEHAAGTVPARLRRLALHRSRTCARLAAELCVHRKCVRHYPA